MGWVPDRPARARAFRVANQVPGLDGLINSILVHGEDDLSAASRPLARRSLRMSTDLAPQYQPGLIERELYRWWTAQDLFAPRPGGEPYVIMMPPPNVTAQLHMGHGLNNTIQDVVIRFERMRGREVLWLPGTDHAGIATQNVVERALAAEGKTRFDLGREAFVARVWKHVDETGATILDQLKAIGCELRLGPHLLHPGRGTLAGGARGVRPALREGADLPRQLHHQLVPALPDGALRRGGREGGA